MTSAVYATQYHVEGSEKPRKISKEKTHKKKPGSLRISYALTAVEFVGSVRAVIVSIALSSDVDASSVGTAELVAMAFFGDTTGRKRIIIGRRKKMSEYMKRDDDQGTVDSE